MTNNGPDIVAGTVGDDVRTVHKLRVLDLHTRRAVCGAGDPDGVTDEWLRAVNCPACLDADLDAEGA
ncbi:hypothetical protein OG875_11300 [Streptomyces sp. NBC_01498]|uniref:hypothetical protein n=1 Tax=Streptomyces sp. NBC_01498 TaxID=2975870 RepID=UPI002E7BEF77|nr:hypothetical protein [Streptomyces sp. NBC_01498]WTL25129.1 hypothetical protein OG875_11300 [Streptomyces sp. NBC_01498]